MSHSLLFLTHSGVSPWQLKLNLQSKADPQTHLLLLQSRPPWGTALKPTHGLQGKLSCLSAVPPFPISSIESTWLYLLCLCLTSAHICGPTATALGQPRLSSPVYWPPLLFLPPPPLPILPEAEQSTSKVIPLISPSPFSVTSKPPRSLTARASSFPPPKLSSAAGCGHSGLLHGAVLPCPQPSTQHPLYPRQSCSGSTPSR